MKKEAYKALFQMAGDESFNPWNRCTAIEKFIGRPSDIVRAEKMLPIILSMAEDSSVEGRIRLFSAKDIIMYSSDEFLLNKAFYILLGLCGSLDMEIEDRLTAANIIINKSKNEILKEKATSFILSIIENSEENTRIRIDTSEDLLRQSSDESLKIRATKVLLDISEDLTEENSTLRVLACMKLISANLLMQERASKALELLTKNENLNTCFLAGNGLLTIGNKLGRASFENWLTSGNNDLQCETAKYIVEHSLFNEDDHAT